MALQTSTEEVALAISELGAQSASLPQPNLHWRELTLSNFPFLFWLVLFAAAAFTGLTAAALMALLLFVQHIAWSYHTGTFLDAVEATSIARRLVVLIIGKVIAGFGAQALSYFGPGGEVSQSVWRKQGKLDLLTSTARSLLAILSVGLGASLGREAAPQLLGGAIASKLSDLAHLPPASRQMLVAITGGAGLACVYNMPLGGAVYVLEVLLASLALPLVLSALAAAVIATASGWVYFEREHTYLVHLPVRSSPSLVIFSVAMGVIAGLVGSAFMQAVKFFGQHKPTQAWSRILAPIIALTGLGALAIPYPQLLGNGYDVTQLAFSDQLSIYQLAVLGVLKPFVTVACVESGVPGGLFTPTLAFGALIGGLAGQGWSCVWPEEDVLQQGAFAVIGAASVLAVSLQGPLASSIVAIELIGNIDGIIVPVLIACIIAVLTSRVLHSPSVYTARLHKEDEAEAGGNIVQLMKEKLNRFCGV